MTTRQVVSSSGCQHAFDGAAGRVSAWCRDADFVDVVGSGPVQRPVDADHAKGPSLNRSSPAVVTLGFMTVHDTEPPADD